MPEKTIAEYEAEQRAEWGVYVAAEAIFINSARAFNAGDPVPASHVERGVVSPDQVLPAGEATAPDPTAPKSGTKKQES